ncbi:hypothetical protein [Limnohabitans sp. DM1]|uniref:hypothetical protein n=1 Tax=Limnohabitans sp. DM1 TaxID=1597955 RepID=UPI001892905B|nr:hypothetical protein [Limnohabitans sp. DM1]
MGKLIMRLLGSGALNNLKSSNGSACVGKLNSEDKHKTATQKHLLHEIASAVGEIERHGLSVDVISQLPIGGFMKSVIAHQLHSKHTS